MKNLLEGKRALVTGGTRGIGRAIAELFAAQGARVIVTGLNVERGENAVAEIVQKLALPKENLRFFRMDVSKGAEVDHAIKQLLEDFGSIEILVNNAGITKDGLLMKLSFEDWDEVIKTNLNSVFHTSKGLIRSMMKARYGKIINMTSVVGLVGNGGQSNYAAAKAGMVGFTKALAKEVASRNICVNAIAPGFIQTDMTDALTEGQRDAIMGQIPMQRLGRVEDIANMALFLASDLSNYMTGQVLSVDGGMAM